MKIGLTYDMRSEYLAQGYKEEDVAEFDSEETIAVIESTIRSLGYETERIGNISSLASKLAKGARWDIVFNVAEGLSGRFRESQVPSLLEIYNIGYTFSDPFVCALTLDKSFSKRVVRDCGIPTAKFKVVEDTRDIQQVSLEYPLFAKPMVEGTGKGIDGRSRVESPAQLAEVCEYLLERFNQPVLVEEYLPGREFTVAVLGNGLQACVLGIMEIKIPGDSNCIYSYNAKEKCEKLVNYVPYRQGGSLHKQLEHLALKSYRVLQCRDAARVDFRCDAKGVPCFMEINPLPGLHPTHSDLPMIATQEAMSYPELIDTIIKSALSRLQPVKV